MIITCAHAIKEVFTSKDQILTTKQIIDAVEKKYPNQWKEITISRKVGSALDIGQSTFFKASSVTSLFAKEKGTGYFNEDFKWCA